MADTSNKIEEAYKINETTKQFNLTDKFEGFAKTKGLSDIAIASAKVEIQNQFAKWNIEPGMTPTRFNILRNNIQAKIETEISRARTELMKTSSALIGVEIPKNPAISPQIPANTPGIKDIQKPASSVGNILQATNGGLQSILAERNKAMNQ